MTLLTFFTLTSWLLMKVLLTQLFNIACEIEIDRKIGWIIDDLPDA
jgi:hypothetical protein